MKKSPARVERPQSGPGLGSGVGPSRPGCGLAEAAFRYSLTAGQEALRLVATGESIGHFEKARQLILDGSIADAEFELQIRDLQTHLGQVYELSDQREQALALYDELERLT